MGTYFGTDGVRGVANADLTPELAFAIGRAGAALIFGGEINEFTKKMIFVVLVVSVIAGAVTLYDTFWGASAVLI